MSPVLIDADRAEGSSSMHGISPDSRSKPRFSFAGSQIFALSCAEVNSSEIGQAPSEQFEASSGKFYYDVGFSIWSPWALAACGLGFETGENRSLLPIAVDWLDLLMLSGFLSVKTSFYFFYEVAFF